MENRSQQTSLNSTKRESGITKQSIRKQVWNYFLTNKIGSHPPPHGRIPNFKGAREAALQLMQLDAFKLAKSVEVNPDKPLEDCRILVLENRKELYVPIPQLKQCLFKKLTLQEGITTRKLVSRWGIENTGTKIGLGSNIHIDLLIVGSVAVSKEGYRIGKGKGFADLEYALLKEINAIDNNTVIITIVHESQVFDDLPRNLFEKYDIPVDYILTPTEIIKVKNVLPRPDGIFWDILSRWRINQIDVLKELKIKYEREGKLIAMNASKCLSKRLDEDTGPLSETIGLVSGSLTTRENNESSSTTINGNIESHRNPRKRNRKQESKSDNIKGDAVPLPPTMNKVDNEVKVESDNRGNCNTNIVKSISNNENIPPRFSQRKSSKYSLMIGNIDKNVRVKDLKEALSEKGIKPDSITWRGHSGFCYLHYNIRDNKRSKKREPFSIDHVIESLEGLKITPFCTNDLTVRVLDPITWIETTDITSV